MATLTPLLSLACRQGRVDLGIDCLIVVPVCNVRELGNLLIMYSKRCLFLISSQSMINDKILIIVPKKAHTHYSQYLFL